MFHVAYSYMTVRNSAINDKMIYWEPHHMELTYLENCVEWLLEEKQVQCDIVKVVRNSIMRSGSRLKDPAVQRWGIKGAYTIALQRVFLERKDYPGSQRIVVKFEDLKCRPYEMLTELCDKWGIKWSDVLLQTTYKGKETKYTDNVHTVTGFDLNPVYDSYENFFSEYDRFRMTLVNTPWHKEYGYPYVELESFTRRELQDILLKKFRFESPGDTTEFYKGHLSLDERIWLMRDLRVRLQEVRCLLKNI